jgi:hypothetical protein
MVSEESTFHRRTVETHFSALLSSKSGPRGSILEMKLYATKYRIALNVVYAATAAVAHQIRTLEAGGTVEEADASFDLSAWKVLDPDLIKGHVLLVWERDEFGEIEEGWDYYDWVEHGGNMAEEAGREGATIATTMPVDIERYLVPAKG